MLLVLLALLQAVAPTMRIIERGSTSWVDSPRQAVARTPDEWARLYKAHAPDKQPPAVDFSKEMVLAVFLGSRPTAGYGVEIIGTKEANGALTVQYRQTRPPPGAITAQVITMPYVMVAVPARAGDVKFERVEPVS
jgi:hypothetical protein